MDRTDQFAMDEGYRLGWGHVQHRGLLNPGGGHLCRLTGVEGFRKGVRHSCFVQAIRDDKP